MARMLTAYESKHNSDAPAGNTNHIGTRAVEQRPNPGTALQARTARQRLSPAVELRHLFPGRLIADRKSRATARTATGNHLPPAPSGHPGSKPVLVRALPTARLECSFHQSFLFHIAAENSRGPQVYLKPHRCRTETAHRQHINPHKGKEQKYTEKSTKRTDKRLAPNLRISRGYGNFTLTQVVDCRIRNPYLSWLSFPCTCGIQKDQ